MPDETLPPACFGGTKRQRHRPVEVGITADILADTEFLAEHELSPKQVHIATAA